MKSTYEVGLLLHIRNLLELKVKPVKIVRMERLSCNYNALFDDFTLI